MFFLSRTCVPRGCGAGQTGFPAAGVSLHRPSVVLRFCARINPLMSTFRTSIGSAQNSGQSLASVGLGSFHMLSACVLFFINIKTRFGSNTVKTKTVKRTCIPSTSNAAHQLALGIDAIFLCHKTPFICACCAFFCSAIRYAYCAPFWRAILRISARTASGRWFQQLITSFSSEGMLGRCIGFCIVGVFELVVSVLSVEACGFSFKSSNAHWTFFVLFSQGSEISCKFQQLRDLSGLSKFLS